MVKHRYGPQKFNPHRPNIADQLMEGEEKINRLLSLTCLQSIPPYRKRDGSRTREGRKWRNESAVRIRSELLKLANKERYPGSITARASGLLRAYENNVVLQGYDRWWVTNKKKTK